MHDTVNLMWYMCESVTFCTFLYIWVKVSVIYCNTEQKEFINPDIVANLSMSD